MPTLYKQLLILIGIWCLLLSIFNIYYHDYENKQDLTPVKHEAIWQKATFTAYTLSEQETDNDPCIGAGNINLCKILEKDPTGCYLATGDRSVPLHTKILVKGIGECEVLDRMNIRYDGQQRFDILMTSYEEAINFGIKELNIIYK